MNIVVQALVVHVIFLFSIFDIYFKSPIVTGVEPDLIARYAPANRLVLFVADGFRSEAFYKACENFDSPFLRSVVETRGTWGISHTRVPTETRPGHVAIIAGLYEDPSAVAKGWKENPVEFDTVFNQSQFTWSWGSPDILPMFAKGASGNHVFMDMYGSELEDFSGKESTIHLDNWVFHKVQHFLMSARNDSELFKKLHSNKIIFFLHLLGLDTAGHTHKPGSKEYIDNVRAVDDGVRKMEELFETFYDNDKKTSYIFTADHGMTDWGSHGAGDPSETETPLIVWGAGINKPKPVTESESKLDTLRKDVKQADIAPLMAALIGIPFPVNSVGKIPKNYLNFTGNKLAEAMFANGRQMLAQYRTKRKAVERGTLPLLYHPFALLTRDKENALLSNIIKDINEEKYEAAISLSEELITLSLSGLDYYQNYYQFLLLTCMTLAYLGWITRLLCGLLKDSKNIKQKPTNFPDVQTSWYKSFLFKLLTNIFTKDNFKVNVTFIFLISSSLFLIFVQGLPFQFSVYCSLPLLLWWHVFQHFGVLSNIVNTMIWHSGMKYAIALVFIYIMGIEILVLSFFYRFMLTFGMLGLMCWPFYIKSDKTYGPGIIAGWVVSCILLAWFPLLPVVGNKPHNNILLLSSILWLLFGAWYIFYLKSQSDRPIKIYILVFQLVILTVTIWNIDYVSSSLEGRAGLPVLNQVLSWLLFGLSIFMTQLSPLEITPRVVSIMIGLAVPFLLLSASHEGIFLLALAINMLCWIYLESTVSDQYEQVLQKKFKHYNANRKAILSVTLSDFRRAFIFLFYIILSFFGTGNIASLNSFDPTWVRCFVTVFSPFLMTTLIMWKTVIPFLTVTCTFRAINVILEVPTEKLFFIVMIFSDVMGMHFLHLVTNQGSWLEIGTSISHFVIIETITLFVVVLYGVAQCLTGTSLWHLIKSDVNNYANFRVSSVKQSGHSLESGTPKSEETETRKTLRIFQRKRHVE